MKRASFLIFVLGFLGWAGWSCGGDWRYNPQYSYGPIVPVLSGYFLWNRLRKLNLNTLQAGPRLSPWFLFSVALMLLPLEWIRQQIPSFRLILWIQAMLAIGVTWYSAFAAGGKTNAKAFAFPLFFLLLAVPWPTRLEEPLTRGLMSMVAEMTEEGLHWIGIFARREGETIALREGMVGVSEACSGIRSLQGAIMVALATGEIFELGRRKRLGLLLLGILFAFLGNLIRALMLCWIGEKEGIEALEKLHDTGGSSILIGVTLGIFAIGIWMGKTQKMEPGRGKLKEWWDRLSWDRLPDFRPPLAVALLGIGFCHAWYLWMERNDQPQVAPAFQLQAGLERQSIPLEVWRNLRPTSGESGVRKVAELPGGRISYYHFFWRPVARNSSGHLHRPDACMGGIGWRLARPVETRVFPVSGNALQWYVLAFEKPNLKVIQLWGVWKNREPVVLDFHKGAAELPVSWKELMQGQRRSGVEIVSCVIPYRDREPASEEIAKILQDAFIYGLPAD